MRIASGRTDAKLSFVAVDSTDLKTRKTGLSSFTVYRSRNGGTATAYTTPTIAELDSTNMPGVYVLTVDEDTTITSGVDEEEYVVHITQVSMAPVTRAVELFRPKGTEGRTLDVSSGGEAGVDWANVGSPTTTVTLSGTTVKTATDVETDTQDIQSRLPAALGANGNIKADVRDFSGTAGTFSSGRPEVNTTHAAGTAWGSGAITAASIASNAITAAKIADAAIDRATFAADTGMQTARSNTAQAGAAGSMTLDASASSTTDFYKGMLVVITGGTGVGQARFVTAYNGTTKVATVGTNWATNPDNTSTFAVVSCDNATPATAIAAVQADTDDIQTRLPAALVSGRMDASVGAYQTGLTPLQPTVAGRTLDVTSTGEAGIDWANIGSPTTTVGLSGTTVKTATDVETDTADIQSRLPAALVSGRIDASVGAMASNVLTAAAMATDAGAEIADAVWDEAVSGHLTAGSTGNALNAAGSAGDPWSTSIPGAYGAGTAGKIVGDALDATVSSRASQSSATDIQGRLPAALVSGRIDASVGAMASGVVTASAVATGAIDADALAADAVTEIVDGVWDDNASNHLTAGTTGAALSDAGSAGDPWSTALPGAYADGTAGQIIGDYLDAAVSTRATQTSVDTIDNFVDTEVAAIASAVADIQSRLPAALISGRMDATVGAMQSAVVTATAIATDAITAAKIAAGAVDASAIATDAGNKIADHVLRRNLGSIADGDSEAFRSLLGAVRKLVNKVAVSGSTLTVYKEDDSTSAGTQAVTTDAAAEPITGVDTA